MLVFVRALSFRPFWNAGAEPPRMCEPEAFRGEDTTCVITHAALYRWASYLTDTQAQCSWLHVCESIVVMNSKIRSRVYISSITT